MNMKDEADLATPLGTRIRRVLFRLVFGVEIEWGDSIFYTVPSLVLIGLLWLMTIEKWFGLSIWLCLIPWLLVVVLLWKAYCRQKAKG